MAFPAFLDTCTLFSPTLTDTLLRIAAENAFRPHWSLGVLEELRRVLVCEGVPADGVERRIAAMESAFPDASVLGYEPLIAAMGCDADDRHVLAAAVHARCEIVVTFNLRHFPTEATAPLRVAAVDPDAFLLDQLDLHPGKVGRALTAQLTAAKRPTLSMGQLLGRLSRAEVQRFTEEASRHEFE